MDQMLMQAMLDVDDHHWWYRGRRRVIRAELDRLALPAHAEILDAGCGSGRTLVELAHYGTVSGAELSEQAVEVARARGVGDVEVARLEDLPWSDDSFDLITCLDVIEHTPDDRVTLAELRRVCRPGGWLLVTVPAYQALWSNHDVANHHFRRYSRPSLRAACQAAGWSVVRLSSFNSVLLAPAAAVRLAARRRPPQDGYVNDLAVGPPWLNSALEWPLAMEAGWLRRGRTLPFGLSLLAVLRCPAPPSRLLTTTAAIIAVSGSLGYLLPAIIGLESFGFPSPGETSLILAAVLASEHKLQIWLVLVIGISSAIIGDSIGYELGRHLGREVLTARGPLQRERVKAVEAGERFFHQHGNKTIFFARWITGVRSAAAWLAGIDEMPYHTFLTFNAAGAITWGLTYGLVGYYGGKAAADVITKIGTYALIVVAVLAVAALAVWLWRRHRRPADPGPDQPAEPGPDQA